MSDQKAILTGGAAALLLILCFVLFSGAQVPPASREQAAAAPAKQTDPPVTAPPATAVPATKAPVTATSFPSPSPTPLPDVQNEWYSEETRYYYPQLTAKEKACYALLYNGIMNFQGKINIQRSGCTIDEVERVWFVLYHDSPELFQLEGSYSYSYISGTVTDVSPDYRLNRTEYDARSRHIRMRFDQVKGFFPADAGDYEKEYTIAKNIIQNCHYLAAGDTSTAYADACLYNGYSQCSGYSRSFSLMMRMAGIPCAEVISVPEEKHEWNMARINGEWYNVDVTFDDGTEEDYHRPFLPGQNEFLLHFNLPSRLFTKHNPDLAKTPFTLPSCTAIRDNYVYREGIYIPAGTRDPVGEINREIEKRTREGKTRFVIMVDDGSADLDGIQKQIIIPGSASRTWSGDKSETRSFFVEKMD